MSRTSGQRAVVGRERKPTRQKCNLSAHHMKYRMETGAMRLAIILLDYFIERVASGEFLNPTWTKIYFLSPLKT
jgi:hypothetical protein